MARSKLVFDVRSVKPTIVRRNTKLSNPVIPTGDRRHVEAVREGSISGEYFSKARLATIPLDPDVERELKKGRGKQVTNAAEKLREGREEGAARDAENIRKRQKSKASVLRDSKKAGRKRQSDKSSKSSVQKEIKKKQKAKPVTPKKKVTKKKPVKRKVTK